jgi:alpha-ketoglutarate-dependent taurine dioxygenase
MKSRSQQLRRQVNTFLCLSGNDLENRLVPNDLIIIRNQGVQHGEHVEHQDGAREIRKHAQHGGSTSQFGIQESDFESHSEFRTNLLLN